MHIYKFWSCIWSCMKHTNIIYFTGLNESSVIDGNWLDGRKLNGYDFRHRKKRRSNKKEHENLVAFSDNQIWVWLKEWVPVNRRSVGSFWLLTLKGLDFSCFDLMLCHFLVVEIHFNVLKRWMRFYF